MALVQPTVVLLHGFLGAARNLRGLVGQLQAARTAWRVLAVDLPGHGAAPPLPPGASLEAVAQATWAALPPDLAGGPVSLVGHSLGGRVAMAMAACALAPPARVALLDISPAPALAGDRAVRALFALVMAAPAQVERREALRDAWVAAGIPQALADWAATNLVRDGVHFVWRLDRAALAAFHARQLAEDLWPVAAALGPRLALLRGGRSAFLDTSDCARLAGMGVQVSTLPAAGHFLQVDAPAEVLAWLLATLGP